MSESYRTVIEAVNPWKPFDWKEILRYRDMFYFKIINGYRSAQRQTVLSYLWVLLDPVINIVFFSIVFGSVAKIQTGEIPYIIFNASAMAGWLFIRESLNGAVRSLKNEATLLKKVYFPRIFIPMVPCITVLPNFLIQLTCTLILLSCYGYYPTLQIFALIPILFIMFIFSTAMGLLLSTFMLQFRDLHKIWNYFMQILMYAIPLAYPVSAIPEKWQFIYLLNPPAALLESFRNALVGAPIPWIPLAISAASSIAFLYIAGVLFKSREPNIVDAY